LWFAGIVLVYLIIQGIGIAAVDVLAEHIAEIGPVGVGRGLLGGLALVVIALASIGSGNDGPRHIAGATDHWGPGAQAGVRRPPCSGAVTGSCAP
jgi:hypothetical protein